MTTNTMTYNGLDTRVGMTDSSGSRTFKRAGIGVTSPVLSDGSASYTPSGETRAGVKTAYHGGMKSFDTQTNSAQAVVGQRLTDAFGNQISSSGVWKGRFAYGGPYGYQEDPDTGLRLLGHRYYDSSTGRFLTRDKILDGRNWYVYCDSNPVSRYDADGLKYQLIGKPEHRARFLALLEIMWLIAIDMANSGDWLLYVTLWLLENSKTVYTIYVIEGNKGGNVERGINTLTLQMDSDGIQIFVEGGVGSSFLEAILAHELGHLIWGMPGGEDNIEGEMEVVRIFENPIYRFFGKPERTSYGVRERLPWRNLERGKQSIGGGVYRENTMRSSHENH